MIKNLLVATALSLTSFGAVAADLSRRASAPAPAFTSVPAFDAFGSVAIGYNDWDGADGLNIQARGTFASTLSGSFGFQADGVFERSRYDLRFDNVTNNTGSLAGHLFWRDSNAGLFGILAQSNSKSSDGLSDHQYFIGVEGQYFIGNITLYGQAAYQSLDFGFFGNSFNTSGVALSGQVRYFATQNFMLAFKGAYSSLNASGAASGVDHDAWLAGAKAEYRFDASPVSLFAEADYRSGTYKLRGASERENEKRLMAGAKWNFGSKSLIQRDRSGGSLDPFRSLAPPVAEFFAPPPT